MKKFDGKKLLVLGSNVSSVDIVEYAKANGAYTIVADYLPREKSSAKLVADKDVLISTTDKKALSEFVNNEKIDGILAGISETNLLMAQALSEENSLPFYCTKEQWDLIENKSCFRELCIKYGVACPKTFFVGNTLDGSCLSKITYPCIIKPVDACMSAGVYICENEQDLVANFAESLTFSHSKNVIIEEFINGLEFSAHFTIKDYKAGLSCVDNRYPEAVHEGKVTTIPIARIYPSLFLDEFEKQLKENLINLCEGINIKNGIVFIQGIYNSTTNKLYVFEAGLRCAGEAPYRFIRIVNGLNPINLLVDRAMDVESEYDLDKEDPNMKGKVCAIVSFVSSGGTVGEIKGLEETVKKVSNVVSYECRYRVGDTVPSGDTLRQIMIRFIMVANTREEMARDINFINANIEVLDTKGVNMVKKFDGSRIYNLN